MKKLFSYFFFRNIDMIVQTIVIFATLSVYNLNIDHGYVRRRTWHCAAIWRLWSKIDITWRLGKCNKRRRRRTLVVSSRDCSWSQRLLSAGSCTQKVLHQRSVSHQDVRQEPYDTCHIGNRGFRCSLCNVARRCLPVGASTGLLHAAVGLGFWATVRTNCARCAACEDPLFPKRLASTSGLKEGGIVCEPQIRLHSTVTGEQQCATEKSEPQNSRERENLETEKPQIWPPSRTRSNKKVRLHVQQPRADFFFTRISPLDRTRCGELTSRPSDAVVEFDVRPKEPREAARPAHSLPTFAAWLHTGWLLLFLGLQQ